MVWDLSWSGVEGKIKGGYQERVGFTLEHNMDSTWCLLSKHDGSAYVPSEVKEYVRKSQFVMGNVTIDSKNALHNIKVSINSKVGRLTRELG